MVFLNAGRINLNLYVCGMYLSQCETILSQIQMFSYPFKMHKIHLANIQHFEKKNIIKYYHNLCTCSSYNYQVLPKI